MFFDNDSTALNQSSSSAKHEVSVTSQALQEEAEKAEEEKERFEAEVESLAAELAEKLSIEPVEVTETKVTKVVKANETSKKRMRMRSWPRLRSNPRQKRSKLPLKLSHLSRSLSLRRL